MRKYATKYSFSNAMFKCNGNKAKQETQKYQIDVVLCVCIVQGIGYVCLHGYVCVKTWNQSETKEKNSISKYKHSFRFVVVSVRMFDSSHLTLTYMGSHINQRIRPVNGMRRDKPNIPMCMC